MKRSRTPEELLLLVAAEVSLPLAIEMLVAERQHRSAELVSNLSTALQGSPARRGEIQPRGRPPGSAGDIGRAIAELPGADKLRQAEAAAVRYALDVTEGNISAAARLLGIGRRSLERRSEKGHVNLRRTRRRKRRFRSGG